MFLRPEQQAPETALPAAQHTTCQEDPALTGQPQHAVQESETQVSSGKADAEAPQLEDRSAPRTHGCDKLLGLLMESMEMLAAQLKGGISNGERESIQGTLSDIERIAATYKSLCSISDG